MADASRGSNERGDHTGATAATDSASRRNYWLKAAWWDLGGLAFCWLPFYVFVVFGLGLTGSWTAGGTSGAGREPGLGLAMIVALAITYVHRHYTFLLVYGDRETFRARRRAYVWVPAVLFVAVALALRFREDATVPFPGLKDGMSPWLVVLTISGLWNVWHTVMQRHGIMRIYAGKAGAGLQERAHGKRDFQMIWSVVAWISIVVLMFRQETFAGLFNARRLLSVIGPVSEGIVGWSVFAAFTGFGAFFVGRWLRAELGAPLALRDRIPRWSFLLSTLTLLAVFVVHGPIIGYLCFGTAHAIEYVFFLHHFGRRKFAQHPEDRGIVAKMLRRPTRWAPVLVGSLVGVFILLRDVQDTEAWLVYYTATSLLHFLYDGWIWKVRKPEVAKPLGLQPARA
jgi:hypothetical protein